MGNMDTKRHWEDVYLRKKLDEVSWFQPHLSKSLDLITQSGIGRDAHIIDIGGGASTFADDLLAKGYSNVSVLDISGAALEISKTRMGDASKRIAWIEGDITTSKLPEGHYDLWHDRAVFHFLTCVEDREQYKKTLWSSLKPQGFAIISVFSLAGPTKCSGLEIVRYSAETLFADLGSQFRLLSCSDKLHGTPFGTTQSFIYCLFQKM